MTEALERRAAAKPLAEPTSRSESEFAVEVDLAPEEVLARFQAHEGVQWNEREPLGWRFQGAPDFQAWLDPRREAGRADGARSFYVRTFVTEDAEVMPPVLHLEVVPTRDGSRVTAHFLKHPKRKSNIYRWAMWGCVMTAAYGLLIGLAAWSVDDLANVVMAMLYFWGGASGIPLMLVLARRANRATPKSMSVYGGEIWTLMGQIFVPHMLGEASDNPFRRRALPGKG